MRYQSLAILAKSSVIPLFLSIGVLAGLNASATDPVYKWKDAKGQSHYSQSAPVGMKYQTITPAGEVAAAAPAPADSVAGTTTAASATTASASAASATSGATPAQIERQKYCDTARKNIDTLSNKPLVDMDINGTGKPVRLSAEQQAQQLALAKQQLAAICSK